jgi:hypothetical protein
MVQPLSVVRIIINALNVHTAMLTQNMRFGSFSDRCADIAEEEEEIDDAPYSRSIFYLSVSF